MESKPSELITVPRSRKLARRRFPGGSDARIITIADGAPVMRRLWHEQNIQCLDVITGNPPRTHAHVAKSSTAQTPRLRLIGRRHSRSADRQQQTVENYTVFLTTIRRFVKAYAILLRKLHARFSEHTFDQANLIPVSRVATHLVIHDRVLMQTGRLNQVHPIERGPSDLVQLPRCHGQLHKHESVPNSHVTKSQPLSPRRQIKGGSSEPQTI
jgi:hypothetical protein